MRALLALVLLGGCVGAGAMGPNGGTRPAVMPMLSELPGDATKRDAVLDSANTAAGPEQRQGMTHKEYQAETAAATAAAILGSAFSSTQSATLGASSQFDESSLAPGPAPRPRSSGAQLPQLPPFPSADEPRPADDPSNADLIPWIKLK